MRVKFILEHPLLATRKEEIFILNKGYTPVNRKRNYINATRTNKRRKNWHNIGYRGLHMWVRKEMGNPTHCSKCGMPDTGRYRTNIQWANVSREYKRELNDWIALCATCHKHFDLDKIKLF